MNTFSKVAGYRISTQKSIVLLYTNGNHTEKESRETVPFLPASKQEKIFDSSKLARKKDMYNKSLKTLRT